jgi:hypothetical protein
MRFYDGRIPTPHPTHNSESQSILVQDLAQNLSETTGPTSIWVAVSIASENWNIMGTSLQENNAALLLHNNSRLHSQMLSSLHQPSACTVVQVRGSAACMKKLWDHQRRTEVASGPVQKAQKVWVGKHTNLRIYLCKLLYHAPSANQQSVTILCFYLNIQIHKECLAALR